MSRWVRFPTGAFCRSEKYTVFRGRSEREILLASTVLCQKEKLRGRNQPITTAKLATFLQSIEAQEVLLRQQLSDLAGRTAWNALQAYPEPFNPEDEALMGSINSALSTKAGGQPLESISESVSQNSDIQTYGDF